jgi:hypothetical protein
VAKAAVTGEAVAEAETKVEDKVEEVEKPKRATRKKQDTK